MKYTLLVQKGDSRTPI